MLEHVKGDEEYLAGANYIRSVAERVGVTL